MTNIENLLSVADQDFVSSGIPHSPYCSLNELLILTHLSQTAVGNEDLNIGSYLATTGPIPTNMAYTKAISLPGNYFSYDTRSAVAIESTQPEIEGMILGYNIAGIRHAGRHLYGRIRALSKSRREEEPCSIFKRNLEKLDIQHPYDSHDSVATLMALIAMNNIAVGEHFESNIRTFTEWYRENYPRNAQFYWAI